jgi:hypothetical protein
VLVSELKPNASFETTLFMLTKKYLNETASIKQELQMKTILEKNRIKLI